MNNFIIIDLTDRLLMWLVDAGMQRMTDGTKDTVVGDARNTAPTRHPTFPPEMYSTVLDCLPVCASKVPVPEMCFKIFTKFLLIRKKLAG